MSTKTVFNKKVQRFEYSEEADTLAKQILSVKDPTLLDALLFPFRIVLVKRHFHHDWAGLCSRQSPLNRFLHGQTFIIQIDRDYWDAASFDKKCTVLIHELHHIGVRPQTEREIEQGARPEPVIRHHVDDFCELANHDTYSTKTLSRIRKAMGWKEAVET